MYSLVTQPAGYAYNFFSNSNLTVESIVACHFYRDLTGGLSHPLARTNLKLEVKRFYCI